MKQVALILAIVAISTSTLMAEEKSPKKTPAFPGTMGKPVMIDRETMMKDMAARSAIADLNRAIEARKRDLYKSNDKIKNLQEKMQEVQKKIDSIVAKDEELKQLKAEHEKLIAEMPRFTGRSQGPRPPVPPAPPKSE